MTTAQSPAQSRITISTPDKDIVGTWSKRSGGTRTSTARRYREGDGTEEVGGSPATTEDMTLSRPYKRDRDIELKKWFRRMAGKVILTISEQPLDDNDLPFGSPEVQNARLLGCNNPDVDHDETTGVQRIEITVAPFGEPA